MVDFGYNAYYNMQCLKCKKTRLNTAQGCLKTGGAYACGGN